MPPGPSRTVAAVAGERGSDLLVWTEAFAPEIFRLAPGASDAAGGQGGDEIEPDPENAPSQSA